MSQRAGDYGSVLLGCSNSYNLKKYGSEQACLDAELPKSTLLTYGKDKRRKGISSGQLMIISACAISVLTYKYSKGNKEFKALLGLLSPFILYYGVAKYKKRKETQEYQSRGEGFNNA